MKTHGWIHKDRECPKCKRYVPLYVRKCKCGAGIKVVRVGGKTKRGLL